MRLKTTWWGLVAIAVLLAVGGLPARAQLNVIRRAREVKLEQEERRTNLENQAEEITENDSSNTSEPSSAGGNSQTRSPQPTESEDTAPPPTAPVTPPNIDTTDAQTAPKPSEPVAVDPIDAQEQYETSVARWHVTHNVCTRSWSANEFSRVFSRIDGELESATCSR
ncbi:MAG: hypothetical protein AAFY57_08990 [Cyanobacteria bacterium J06642_2]